ncbi:B-cell receptor CD22-like [Scyliorhinus torazame]|uniref:B-cell receptor CD22-like n=1 Tax=Scyliorhinus torazame TaxID=75743 RepID=UPI003B5AB9C9
MDSLLVTLLLLLASWDLLCQEWHVKAPESVTGAVGLCVVIPCTFQHPYTNTEVSITRVGWLHQEKVDGIQVVNSTGFVHSHFQDRTNLLGNWQTGTDCTLEIKNLQQGDEGIYHFRMEFSDRNKYSDPNGVLLNLTDASSLITISPRTAMKEGTEVDILCSVRYLCRGLLRWIDVDRLNRSKSSEIIGTAQNEWGTGLQLSFVTSYRDNERTLKCKIHTSTSQEEANRETILNVQYAPKLVYIDSSHYTQSYEGGRVTLTCVVLNSNPPVTSYTWRREGRVGFYGSTHEKSLTISTVHQSYRCEATNSLGTTSSDDASLVKLSDNSWGVWSPLAVRAIEGSCAVIPCRFHYPNTVQGTGEKTGKWLKGHHYHGDQVYLSTGQNAADHSRRVEFLGSMDSGNCTLRINDLNRTDSGKYYFRIEIGEDKWSQKTGSRLLVSDTPEKPVITAPEMMNEDKFAMVTCSVQSSCPDEIPVLQWNTTLRSNLLDTVNSYRDNLWIYSRAVTFTPRFEDRDQTLRCWAQFEKGVTAKSELQLNLQYKPRNVSMSLTINGKAASRMKEGDHVVLQCDAAISNPAVSQYTWYNLKGIRQTSGQILEFYQITYTDYGKYFCKASNSIGVGISEVIELQGQYAPRDFDISYMLNNEKILNLVNVMENDWLNITCQSRKSDPAVTGYNWFRTGRTQSICNTQMLLFNNVTRQDRGEYYCQAWNGITAGKSNIITINVNYPPSNVRIDCSNSVQDGKSVKLTCESEAYPSPYYFSWSKECSGAPSALCGNVQSCTFTVTVKDALCKYYCTAANRIGNQRSGPKQLNVLYKPQSVTIDSKDTVKDGTKITLTCKSDANPSANTFQWRKRCNGSAKTLQGMYSSIQITVTSVDELCDYTCQAQNYIGVQESEHKHINVQYLPKNVKVETKDKTRQEGDKVTLECESRSNPEGNYTWIKDSVELRTANSQRKTLTINSVSVSDSGNYSCEVENSLGKTVSLPITIKVLYIPRNTKVSISQEKDAIWEGDNVTLTCNTDCNPPAQSYKWTLHRGGKRIVLPLDNSVLTLYRITGKDEGLYFCEARNQLGTHESSGSRLSVRKSNIKLIVIILVLLLVILFMVGSAVMFYRRRKINEDSISQQQIEASNTVYNVVMKRNRAKETTVYENMVMTENMDSRRASPFEDNVEYASINFTYAHPGGQQQKEAARKKRKKTPIVNCDNDPSVIYSLVQKAPPSSKHQASDDYENVSNLYRPVAESSDDELNYTSLVLVNHPGKRVQRQDSLESTEYTDIKF